MLPALLKILKKGLTNAERRAILCLAVRAVRHSEEDTAGLCKGSTADSDSVCEGSNPSPAANIKKDVRILHVGAGFLHLINSYGK